MGWPSPHSTAENSSFQSDVARSHHLPRAVGRFGMILFLISLGILFAASLLGYLIIRIGGASEGLNEVTGEPIEPTAPGFGQIDLPTSLWLSTGVILISSLTIHRALQGVRRERQKQFRGFLLFTLALAGGFLLVQVPALRSLLLDQYGGEVTTIYGLIFTLILIHALHVVGGIVPLIAITYRAHQGGYDHEMHQPVSHMVAYWHFLDAVWLVMFLTLMLAS